MMNIIHVELNPLIISGVVAATNLPEAGDSGRDVAKCFEVVALSLIHI